MSLPDAWVQRILDRMTLVYGARFTSQWSPELFPQVRELWARELSPWQQSPQAITWALNRLPPDRPPTVLEFRALLVKRPISEKKEAPYTKVAPDRIKSILGPIRGLGWHSGGDREWAFRLEQRERAGETLTIAQRRMWRQALGVNAVRTARSTEPYESST